MANKKGKYYKRPDGLYEAIRVVNGKRKAFRGRSPKEVEQKMIAYRENVEQGPLFKDVAAIWRENHYKTISPTTAHGYEASYKRSLEAFGLRYIEDISPSDIDAYLKQMAQKKYGRKTVTTMFLILNLIFTSAVVSGFIKYNPCTSISVPKGLMRTPRKLPSDADIEAVKSALNLPGGLLPYFILYTGCRRGEVLALTYADIDREEKLIYITKAIHFDHNKPKLKPPKTQAGIREIILLDKLEKVIPNGKPNDLLFSGPDGKYLNEAKLRRNWTEWQQAAGTKVTAHQLRHGYATMLFEAGIDEKDAQDLLGHTSLAMTRDIYTHIRQKRKKETAKKLNEAAENF